VGNIRERDHLGDSSVDGSVILGWIFRTWGLGCGLDRSGLGWGQLAGICKCDNEPSGFIKFEEILNYLKTV
jgi:hypothetical protein